MPIVIKRYPNRKLYNTVTKRYITLDGIATLIQQGQEIQVVDHTSDEDLTTLTLTQIIFEQEKKSSGFLPKPVLTDLIRAGGKRLGTLRKTLTPSRDMFNAVESEIDRRLQELTKSGELAVEEGARLRDKMLGQNWFRLPTSADLDVNQLRENIPFSDELKNLFSQLDTITASIQSLVQANNSQGEPVEDIAVTIEE